MASKGIGKIAGVAIVALLMIGTAYATTQGYLNPFFTAIGMNMGNQQNVDDDEVFGYPLAIEGVIQGKFGDTGAASGHTGIGTNYVDIVTYDASSGSWNSSNTKYAPHVFLVRHSYETGYYDLWDTTTVPDLPLSVVDTGAVTRYPLGTVNLDKRVADANLKLGVYDEAGALLGSVATGASHTTNNNITISTTGGLVFTMKATITIAEYKVTWGNPVKVLMSSPTYYLKDTQAVAILELEGTTYPTNTLIQNGWTVVGRYSTLNSNPATVFVKPLSQISSSEGAYGSVTLYIPLDVTSLGTSATKMWKLTITDMYNFQDATMLAGTTTPATGAGITTVIDAVVNGYIIVSIS